MSWIDDVRNKVPGYAKDLNLNLDNVINRSSLDEVTVKGIALASALAANNHDIVELIKAQMVEEDINAAMAAASIMAMTNVWYPYIEMANDPELKGLPAQLRMNVIASHGGTTKAKFEAYSLAASIIGRCHFCVKAHYDTLKKEGFTAENLRDVGRIAAVMAAVCKVTNS